MGLFSLFFVLGCTFFVTALLCFFHNSKAEKYRRMANNTMTNMLPGKRNQRYKTLYWLMVNQIYGSLPNKLHETDRMKRLAGYGKWMRKKQENDVTMEELGLLENEDQLKNLATAYEKEAAKAAKEGKKISSFGEVARTIMIRNRINKTTMVNRTVNQTMMKTQAMGFG